MTEAVENTPDYGTPMQFLIGMLIFSFVGFHIDAMMGVWTVIGLGIWALLTLHFYVKWRKGGGETGDGGWFGLLIITLSIAGLFLETWLNVESFVLLLIWVVIAAKAYAWLKTTPKADPRLYYLISAQFLVIAIVMPLLMRYVNPVLMGVCPSTEIHSVHASTAVHGQLITEPVLVAENTEHAAPAEHGMAHEAAPAEHHAPAEHGMAHETAPAEHHAPAEHGMAHEAAPAEHHAPAEHGMVHEVAPAEHHAPAEHGAAHEAVGHAVTAQQVSLSLISAFNTVTFLVSIWLCFVALRLGMANAKPEEEAEVAAALA